MISHIAHLLSSSFLVLILGIHLNSGDTQRTLIVSVVEQRPYAEYVRNSDGGGTYEGFLPDLLSAIQKKSTVKFLSHYEFKHAPGNKVGEKVDNDWTGMIREIVNTQNGADLGIGPLIEFRDLPDYFKYAVIMSSSYMSAGLTLVVRKSSNVSNVHDALQQHVNLIVVRNSPELRALKAHRSSAADQLKKLANTTTHIVGSMEDGLKSIMTENDALLLNTKDATYQVTHAFCNLKRLDTYVNIGGFVIAMKPTFGFAENLDRVIDELMEEGVVRHLRDRWWGRSDACNVAIAEINVGLTAALLVPSSLITIGLTIVKFF